MLIMAPVMVVLGLALAGGGGSGGGTVFPVVMLDSGC
jgi:hypothetical protein